MCNAGCVQLTGGVKKKSDYLWVVDPLDGTTNYIIGNPLFAVSICLIYKKELIIGVVYAPFLHEIFWAEKGEGAWLNDTKIKVSKSYKVGDTILTFCHGNMEENIKQAIFNYI